MMPIPTASMRRARLLDLLTPLAVMAGLVVLLMLPTFVMHMGLRSNASPVASMVGNGAASNSAAAAVESPPVVR